MYVEGDAQLMMQWSMRAVLASTAIQPSTRAFVQQDLDTRVRLATDSLRRFVGGPQSYDDRIGNYLWEGIGVTLAERAGSWSYLRRYIKAWREDDAVRDIVWGPRRPSAYWSTTTTAQRATFFAAAMSAAMGQDLRAQFRTWKFPLDDVLFQRLFDYFIASM
jgi:hypothetical protein